MKTGVADTLNGRYITHEDVRKPGGKWDDRYEVYVFPDGTTGRFTDLVNGAAERILTGEPLLHFVVSWPIE